MALALLVLLVAGYGGAFVTARRWLRTGSSLAVFVWAAAMVTFWPVLQYELGAESAALVEAGWQARGARWFVATMIGLVVLAMGWVWADRPPLEEPRRGASRLGRSTFLSALLLLAGSVLGLGSRSMRGLFDMGDESVVFLLGLPASFLLAAAALNLACFFAAASEKRAGGCGPSWFLASVFGFAAVAVYSLQAIFEVVRGVARLL